MPVVRSTSLALREAEAKPAVEALHTLLIEQKEPLLPKHPLAQAIGYALNQWKELTFFLIDGARYNLKLWMSARSGGGFLNSVNKLDASDGNPESLLVDRRLLGYKRLSPRLTCTSASDDYDDIEPEDAICAEAIKGWFFFFAGLLWSYSTGILFLAKKRVSSTSRQSHASQA